MGSPLAMVQSSAMDGEIPTIVTAIGTGVGATATASAGTAAAAAAGGNSSPSRFMCS